VAAVAESKFISRVPAETTRASIALARQRLEHSERTVLRVQQQIERFEAVLRRLHDSFLTQRER
jgi:hypothetical protein